MNWKWWVRKPVQAAAPPDLAALRQASDGLLYPSESDEPFTAFAWPPARDPAHDTAQAQVVAHSPKGAAVSEQTVDDFFAQLQGSPDAGRYAQLRKVLEQQLAGLKAFRAGEVRVAVYLIGKAPSGSWAGLQTLSVET